MSDSIRLDPIDISALVKLLREPYELILDRLLADGRISGEERDSFRQCVKDSDDKLYNAPVKLHGRLTR